MLSLVEDDFFFSYYGGKPVKAALHASALRYKLVFLQVEVVGEAGRAHPQEQEPHPCHLLRNPAALGVVRSQS